MQRPSSTLAPSSKRHSRGRLGFSPTASPPRSRIAPTVYFISSLPFLLCVAASSPFSSPSRTTRRTRPFACLWSFEKKPAPKRSASRRLSGAHRLSLSQTFFLSWCFPRPCDAPFPRRAARPVATCVLAVLTPFARLPNHRSIRRRWRACQDAFSAEGKCVLPFTTRRGSSVTILLLSFQSEQLGFPPPPPPPSLPRLCSGGSHFFALIALRAAL